ncbi:MAG: methyltransferase domain-containing protein [Solobacterium sp.]|nr:methyltransferase domain-containing protein [Solobacterium sp.]
MDDKNTTLNYYNTKSDLFVSTTKDLEFTDIQDGFLKFLNPGSLVLDFGCGSGRDSKYFLQKGYLVEAMDGSEEMVRIATEVAGIPVKHMLFQELDEENKYDGIFACASILHVKKEELADVLQRMKKAVKDQGIIYVSFKYGDFEGYRNGRYFTDMTEESFRALLEQVSGLSIVEERITSDARPGRENEKWLNVILRKD